MSKKFLSVALVGSMAMASGATVMAAETGAVTVKEALDSGMIKRTSENTSTISMDLTIDLNGKTLSSIGLGALKINNNANVKIINGKINSEDASAITLESGTLTLEGVTINSKDASAIKVESGTVNVIGKGNNTISSNKEAIEVESGIVNLEGLTIKSEYASAINVESGTVNLDNINVTTNSNNTNVVSIATGNVTFKNVTLNKPNGSKESHIGAKNNVTINLQGNINANDVSKDVPLIECTDASDGGLKINAEDAKLNTGDANDKKEEIYKQPSKVDTGDDSGGGSTGGGSISKPEYTHTQIIGKDRYETAAKLADKLGNYDTVILVNSDKTMADGLSAASLAGKLNAPILPVKQNKIPDSVMQRIEKAKNVYIIGGTEAISKDVENKLSDKKITRIGGETRFETSEKIASMIGNYSEAYIVNGVTGEADAMSISPVAAKKVAPIIVTDGKKSDYEKKSGTDYTVIGGEKAVTEALEEKYSADRISGANRYETNRAVIMKYYASVGTIYLANGETMIDALTASLVAKDNGVVLVSRNSDNSILKSRNTVQVGGMNFDIKYE